MKTKLLVGGVATALLALFIVGGCGKPSSAPPETAADSDTPEVAGKKMTTEIDKMAEEVLQSEDKVEAADWLKRYPKSEIGEDEDGRPVLLAPVVARLREAGAQRIVIETARIGQGEFLVSMVVVLPADAAARQKLFAMDAQLSQLCQQTQVIDRGQKYLHYSFD